MICSINPDYARFLLCFVGAIYNSEPIVRTVIVSSFMSRYMWRHLTVATFAVTAGAVLIFVFQF